MAAQERRPATLDRRALMRTFDPAATATGTRSRSVKCCVNELLQRAVITGAAEQAMNGKRCSSCGSVIPRGVFSTLCYNGVSALAPIADAKAVRCRAADRGLARPSNAKLDRDGVGERFDAGLDHPLGLRGDSR
jgi:hypothetical protein